MKKVHLHFSNAKLQLVNKSILQDNQIDLATKTWEIPFKCFINIYFHWLDKLWVLELLKVNYLDKICPLRTTEVCSSYRKVYRIWVVRYHTVHNWKKSIPVLQEVSSTWFLLMDMCWHLAQISNVSSPCVQLGFVHQLVCPQGVTAFKDCSHLLSVFPVLWEPEFTGDKLNTRNYWKGNYHCINKVFVLHVTQDLRPWQILTYGPIWIHDY